MLKVALLDDYAGVALESADWAQLDGKAEITVFREHLTEDEAAERGLWTQEYLTRVLRILQQEQEAIEANARGDLASEDVAAEVSATESR